VGYNYNFIINPKSGSSVNLDVIRDFRDYLCRSGREVRIDLTRSLTHAGELAQESVRTGCAAIVVAGGDGTVRAVAEAIAGSDVPILVIPCGTENLLAQELGLDGSLKSTIITLEHGLLRNLDLGKANDRHFMAIIGVGFDAEVVRRINLFRCGHITHADYIWPICRTYWEYHQPQLRVEADGQLICDEPGLVFVGNISRYAVGLGIVPYADFSDGRLDLTIYKCRRKRELLIHAVMTILQRSSRSPNVTRLKCSRITLSSPERDVPVQIDGDPGPKLPLHIEIIPAAAKVLTPPPPAGHKYHPPVRYYHLRRWLI